MKTIQAPIPMTNAQIIEHANQQNTLRTMCTDYFDSVFNRNRRLFGGHIINYSFDLSDVNNIKIIMHYEYSDQYGIQYGKVEIPIHEFDAWCIEYYKVTLTCTPIVF